MMLNEIYTKNIQPRDPERIRSDIETPCATVYNQGVTPVLYDNAVQASSRPGRAVEYLPENTIALSVSECVMMFLIQLVPVLGLIMAAVWSFSPNSGINKRTISPCFAHRAVHRACRCVRLLVHQLRLSWVIFNKSTRRRQWILPILCRWLFFCLILRGHLL